MITATLLFASALGLTGCTAAMDAAGNVDATAGDAQIGTADATRDGADADRPAADVQSVDTLWVGDASVSTETSIANEVSVSDANQIGNVEHDAPVTVPPDSGMGGVFTTHDSSSQDATPTVDVPGAALDASVSAPPPNDAGVVTRVDSSNDSQTVADGAVRGTDASDSSTVPVSDAAIVDCMPGRACVNGSGGVGTCDDARRCIACIPLAPCTLSGADSSNECKVGITVCAGGIATCTAVNRADGSECSRSNLCVAEATCQAGSCRARALRPAGTSCSASPFSVCLADGTCAPVEPNVLCSLPGRECVVGVRVAASGECIELGEGFVFPRGHVCRPANPVLPCDAPDVCDGESPSCVDRVVPFYNPVTQMVTVCRPASAPCDADDYCNGFSATCPADLLSTGICRAPQGPCHDPDDPVLGDSCNGVSRECPAPRFVVGPDRCGGNDYVCGDGVTCDGTSAQCTQVTVRERGAQCNLADVDPECGGCNGTSAGPAGDRSACIIAPDDTACSTPAGTPAYDENCRAPSCQGGRCVMDNINEGGDCFSVGEGDPCQQGRCRVGECVLEPRTERPSECDSQ